MRDEALAIGLVTEIADDPVARALELAAEIAAFPQETVRSDRRAVLEGEGLDARRGPGAGGRARTRAHRAPRCPAPTALAERTRNS